MQFAAAINYLGYLMSFKKIAVALAIAGCAVGNANAIPLVATGAVSLFGVSSAPAGSIGLNTTFSFLFSVVSSTTGGLMIVPNGTFFTTMAMTSTAGSAVNFSADWGSFAGVVSSATATGAVTDRVVSINASGTFTPLAGPPDLSGFDAGPMILTFSANQTGSALGSISANYSIATVATQVPEPGSLALAALGLLAAAGVARRKATA